jgi:hypothetical protein
MLRFKLIQQRLHHLGIGGLNGELQFGLHVDLP